MPLTPGTELGPYEIVELLGSGGMGEVYRARDSRLGRNVAIKILPAAFSQDRERLHRFEREARSASALNHPNIITIYERGQHGPTHYIAMEFVEGDTLRRLLNAGPLPIRKTIEIASQIADGLANAHEAGIAHRDMKPENLMLSRDGFVKILDFGLAKPDRIKRNLSQTLTDSTQTGPGMLLGTTQYMSPEQASGLQVDFRSDQFSFGLVLYELLTGKSAFKRNTTPETIVAILREQAQPIALLNPDAPAPLCWTIERCLAKDPDKRYASTRDLARELAAIHERFSEAPPKPSEPIPATLPVPRTRFIGREKEVSTAKDLLLRDDVRLLTITGPGGIGKTRLALHVANTVAEHFPGGIHFVPLSSLTDPGLIASAIVQTLNIREAGAQSPLEMLKENFQRTQSAPMVLLLDNFEHLIQAAPTVAELLAVGPHLKIVVTSRAALHIYGEHEFAVPPLVLPDPRSLPPLKALSQYSAISLFVERAIAARPDFELTRENAPVVAEICARLDGLPLAIELAAARVKVLSPSSMCTRLASRFQLLTGGARDLPMRQQTLRAAIDWSYDLLNPAEQKLFRRLSVLMGGCTLEAAEAVCDTKADLDLDLLDGIASLVDKSLLQQVEPGRGESRFVMLQTIREYGLEKLQASGEASATKRAHAAYFLVLAEEGAAEQLGADGSGWLERLTVEHENLRAALEWLTETEDVDWGFRLGSALFRFWEMREYLAEGRDALDKLLKLPGATTPSKALARAFFAAGVLASEQGDYAAADARTGESLNVARKLQDQHGIAVSLNALAVHARDRGDIPAARSLFEECLELWRQLDDRKAVARALSNLASVVKAQGDYSHALSLYAECLSIFQELGDTEGVAWSLNYQGDVARDQTDSVNARILYGQALEIFQELNDRWGVAGTLADLGTLAREQNDYASAFCLFQESLRVFQELEHRRGIARLLECFACLAATQLHAERSLRLAGTAAALRQKIGAPLNPAEQLKLEASLDPVRQTVGNTEGATAWLEGWVMPVEKAIEEILMSADSAYPN